MCLSPEDLSDARVYRHLNKKEIGRSDESLDEMIYSPKFHCELNPIECAASRSPPIASLPLSH